MSEYLRYTADYVAELVRQKRREMIESGQLAARLSRILQRRGLKKGLVGALGPEEMRQAAEVARPETAAEKAEEVGAREEMQASAEAEAAPAAEPVGAMEAAESAAAEELEEGLPTEKASVEEAVTTFLDEEASELAEVVEEIQTVLPEAETPEEAAPAAESEPERARAPLGMALLSEEVPFEAALEPQALIPARVEFARASDEVFFRRAIERLGMGEARRVREGIRMLGQVRSDAAAGVLMNFYRIAPTHWRVEAVHELVTHPGGGIAEFFCHVLQEQAEPAIVRLAALRGVFARDKALAAEYLLRAVDDPDEGVRAAAATHLGWLREKRAVPALEKLLGDASQQVAKAALHAAALVRG